MAEMISFLISVCIVAAVIYLVLWVLGQIGVPLPPMVIKIVWIIVGLVILLYLWQSFGAGLRIGSFR